MMTDEIQERVQAAAFQRIRLLLTELAGIQEELDGLVEQLRGGTEVSGKRIVLISQRLRRARSRLHATMEDDRANG